MQATPPHVYNTVTSQQTVMWQHQVSSIAKQPPNDTFRVTAHSVLTSLHAGQLFGIFTLPCLYANICTALQQRILFKKHYVHCIIKSSMIYTPHPPRKKLRTGLLPGYGATVVTLWNPLRKVPLSSPMIVQAACNGRRRGDSCRLLSTDTLTPISCTSGHKAVLSATHGPRIGYIDVTIKLMVLECTFFWGGGISFVYMFDFLQAGRLSVRSPLVSLVLFIDIILPAALLPCS